MVADGELTLVDEMIAARVYAASLSMIDGLTADTWLGGSLLKKRLLQDSGTTSNATLMLRGTLRL
jgi:hypothetical protein